ncbi:2',5'-phosphodiesterase 12 [Phlebotomus argentipes]|uniref:2',5'-phosphodiesterase 12 n=1 Tax=Phlebotomus argentipes TaxID=94469 RepID=UPI002892CBD8|nr:2',5'-phosphodiesterase 12 [Phlebotomus argentipes]
MLRLCFGCGNKLHVSKIFWRSFTRGKLWKFGRKMDRVYFRHADNDGSVDISFRYTNAEHNIDRVFNFRRNVNELVQGFTDRTRTNIEKEFNKHNKKKQKKKSSETAQEAVQVTPPEIIVQLTGHGEDLSGKTFQEILVTETLRNSLELSIHDQKLPVAVNYPFVDLITLPASILAGFFVYPSKIELSFASENDCTFTWYRGMLPKNKILNNIEFQEVGKGFAYFAKLEDVDHYLKVVCIPRRDGIEGPSVECLSKCTVQASPGECPFELRHKFTSQRLSGEQFRVASYNLLADCYADSDFSRQELFPYCPPYALHIDYRKQLFIKELLGYNCDIICLQEVDARIYDMDLDRSLRVWDFDGHFTRKGDTVEGLAIFYNRKRFRMLKKFAITYGEQLKKMDIFAEIYEKIRGNEELATRVVERSTTLQVVVLESLDNPGEAIIVANTHLYFHPNADHMRLLQFGLAMIFIEKHVLPEVERDLPGVRKSLIFAGDFNSVPECGIYKLMTENFVPSDFIDFQSKPDQEIKDVELRQSLPMSSACGCPEFTNFTVGFKACLDYIFYQTNNLNVVQVIPFPSTQELEAHIAIPSVVFPSDHIALVADLSWRK